MKKQDLPAMPFYIGDWKKDPAVQSLTREEKMIWLELLFLMWESKERGYLTVNNKPMTNIMLSIALNLDNQRLTSLLNYFDELGLYSKRDSDGAIYSRKIINIVELSEKRKNAGKQGGNPKLVNQDLTKSQASSYPNAENENENEDVNEDDNINGYSFENFWNDYDKKVGDKSKIEKKFNKLSESVRNSICEYIPKYKKAQPDKQYRKNPDTFLNQKGWEHEIIGAQKEYDVYGK